MKYIVVSDENPDAFVEKVNSLLKSNWKLQGGLSVINNNGKAYFYQAMVLEATGIYRS